MLASDDSTSTAGSAVALSPGAEYICGFALKPRFPRCDLAGADVETLGRLRQRRLTLARGKRHIRLDSRNGYGADAYSSPLSMFLVASVCQR